MKGGPWMVMKEDLRRTAVHTSKPARIWAGQKTPERLLWVVYIDRRSSASEFLERRSKQLVEFGVELVMNTWISYKKQKDKTVTNSRENKVVKERKKEVRSLPLGLAPKKEYSVKII